MFPRLVNISGSSYVITTGSTGRRKRIKCARSRVIAKKVRKVRAELIRSTMVRRNEKHQKLDHQNFVGKRNMHLEYPKIDANADTAVIHSKATIAIATSPSDIDRTPLVAPSPLFSPVKIESGRCDRTRTRQPLDPKALENQALHFLKPDKNDQRFIFDEQNQILECIDTYNDSKFSENGEVSSNQSVSIVENQDGKQSRFSDDPEENGSRHTTVPTFTKIQTGCIVQKGGNKNLTDIIKNRQSNVTYCTKRAAKKRFEDPSETYLDLKYEKVMQFPSSPHSTNPSPGALSECTSHCSIIPSPTSTISSSSSFLSPSPTSSSNFSSIRTSTSEVITSTSSSGPNRSVTSITHAPLDTLKSALEGYDNSRIYLAHVSFLDWRDLPGRRTVDSERIWVVGAADHGGRHRTRLLVAGRHWRPRCLSKVNMVTQPVVYAGGGSGSLTADLFLWWFHREFATTAMAMHPDGAILVAEAADYLPPEVECVTADGLVRLFVVPKDCLEPRIVANELRVRLAAGLLTSVRYSPYFGKSSQTVPGEITTNDLEERVKRFTLKEAFAELHRAWLGIRSETFARSWILMQERESTRSNGRSSSPIGDALSSRSQRVVHKNEDGNLLGELLNLAREAGLDVDDSDLRRWVHDEASEFAKHVMKKELVDSEEDAELYKNNLENFEPDLDDQDVPTARETVGLLSKVLLWMEREPLDPGLLLAVRSMRETAAIMASKMGLTGTHPGGLPFFCPNGDHLTQPPPAHMGIPPYGALDAGKAAAAAGEYWPPPPHGPPSHPAHWKRLLAAAASTGLTRAPMYPFSTGQYPYPMLSPEMTQVAASWHTPSMYPISPASAGFRSPYPTSLPITSSSLPSDLYRFSPTGLMPPHPGLSPHAHALASHALVSSAPKSDHATLDHNHRSSMDQKNSTSLSSDNTKAQDTGQQNNQDKKKPHIKKPLNAFMLYMKEMRAKVVAECTLKESAAINQILGRRWHALGREEQAKYYELARRERQLHMQLYPDWSSRANTNRTKKRKRKQDTNSDPGGNNMKKCRARYGLDQQSQWCKPCRRKKKCIRYMGEGGDGDGDGDGDGEVDGDVDDDHSEDNLGSVGEAGTPEDDESLSSPGGLSALSSLASPSLVLPSPSSLASPCPCPLTPPVQSTSLTNNSNQNTIQSVPPPHRNPVGTNPHDINNPLSVNQLTGQCIKNDVGGGGPSGPSNPAISVT
ncbi:uncharacterized protein [Venturia canescens]|uniref:uncharacterized protein isoform X2 n=1 Tax=Venturia canescens TaxID=32260 RepID=UPI001C9C75E1|nr:uncharacterized protein LOC122408223 isoform X2 [Venturia canescens]